MLGVMNLGKYHALWALERVFCTLRLGKGTVWRNSVSLLPPPRKGFLWLRSKGNWKGGSYKGPSLIVTGIRGLITDAPTYCPEDETWQAWGDLCRLGQKRMGREATQMVPVRHKLTHWASKNPCIQQQKIHLWGGPCIWWLHKTVGTCFENIMRIACLSAHLLLNLVIGSSFSIVSWFYYELWTMDQGTSQGCNWTQGLIVSRAMAHSDVWGYLSHYSYFSETSNLNYMVSKN